MVILKVNITIFIKKKRKRKAVEKADDDVKTKTKKEFDKNYEESRQGRVSSWQNFKTKSTTSSVSIKSPFFRPPKPKPESR